MGIPIKEYIDIKTTVVDGIVGDRDFSGLVFSKTAMKTTVPSEYTTVKSNYDAGEAVSLTLDDINQCFDDGDVKTFATLYFGYNGGNKRPPVLNLAKVLTTDGTDETALTAYNRVISEFSNFGSFTFLGTFANGAVGAGGLLDVATAANAVDSGAVMIVVTDSTNYSTDAAAFNGMKMVHIIVNTVASGTNFGAWMSMAWFASVDYNKTNASGTIDYKRFSGATAEVTSETTKHSYDALYLNYIGKVQVYGTGLAFYQQGANMDGHDLGVIRDSIWINGKIISGYFNLQDTNTKIPANYVGAAMVQNLLVSVATLAITNGSILKDKPLTTEQINTINQYAGDDSAADKVASCGYYTSTNIVKSGNRYVCEYTLIYAKGDHIGKVSGSHILV